MKSKPTMGDTLKQAFAESGMSMKRLADESGTGYMSVHSFFTGKRSPQLETVERWCRVLGLRLVRRGKRKQKGT